MTLYSKTFDIESFRPFEMSRHCSRAFEFIIIDEELGTSLISKPRTFFFFLGEGGGGGGAEKAPQRRNNTFCHQLFYKLYHEVFVSHQKQTPYFLHS